MSELYNVIGNIVRKELNELNLIKTAPCKVVHVLGHEKVEVELIANKARYKVSNYSGSPVNIGETVQLFYRGTISENSAYIGASFYKSGATTNYVIMDSKTGLIGSEYSIASKVNVKAINDTNIEITYNASILGTNNGEVEFVVNIDGIEQDYKPLSSTVESSRIMVSFSIPSHIKQGKHSIEIRAKGTASIERVYAFVRGQVEKIENVFDDITSGDFVYITNDMNADIALYVGTSLVPKIPDTINGNPVGVLCASAFNVSNIEAVYIPDGVTEIE